jgi:hypothetical protein
MNVAMKIKLLFILIVISQIAKSQVFDDFEDGDFTVNPIWSSSITNADFTVINKRLRSNSSLASNNFSISTANQMALNTKWEFWVNLQFNTSGSNYVDVYLISDKADLKSNLINGYFIRIGHTNDEIALYKRSGLSATSVKLIDGVNGVTNTSSSTLKIRITRNNQGLFTLERALSSTTNSYFLEGSIADLDFTTSSFFGIFIQQSTASFFQKHFFDDFLIESMVSDKNPPELVSAETLDSNTIEITFNEAMDSLEVLNKVNYSFENYEGQIEFIETTSDPAKFKIKLTKPLNTGNYTIKIISIKDKSGNVIQDKNSASFTYKKPYKPQVGDILINEIFADPTPQIDLPSVEFIELFNKSEEPISLHNWKLSDVSSSGTLVNTIMPALSYLILCAKSDTAEFKKYGNVLGISPWPSLSNAGEEIKLRDQFNNVIDSVFYLDSWHSDASKRQGGWSLERISPTSKCTSFLNWESAIDQSGGTPGKQNSVFITNYEKMDLTADSLHRLTDSTLIVFFNKPLNNSYLNKNNFIISPASTNLKEITSSKNQKQLILKYEKKFESGTDYKVKIENLKDCDGKTVSNNQSLEFSTPKAPVPPPPPPVRIDTAQVIITEFFADPSPEVGLPLVEFIEIFNPGLDTVDLQGWSINDPQTKGTMKKYMLPPNEYLILSPTADTAIIKGFGKTLGISPWPSLKNSSDEIILKSFKNRTVDSLNYSDTWYKDSKKMAGGWSLEKIDLNNPLCSGFYNWGASLDSAGGTPGRRNSLKRSNHFSEKLKIDSLKIISENILDVYFNQIPDTSYLKAASFSIKNGTEKAKTIQIGKKWQEIRLFFQEKFKEGEKYILSADSLFSCSGNLIRGKDASAELEIPTRPEVEYQIIINEIFADPSPQIDLPSVEFIELFNKSDEPISLHNWKLSDVSSSGTLVNTIIPALSYLILCAKSDTAEFKKYGNVLGISPWPSLSNAGEEIKLRDQFNNVIDSVFYLDSWHSDASKRQGGWSFERISPTSKCTSFLNWESAIDQSGGTPGKQNSVFIPNYEKMYLTADSLHRLTDSTLIVFFNKPLNNSYLNKNNFIISPASTNLKEITSSKNQKQLILKYEKKFESGTDYKVKIENLKDCDGKTVSNNQSLEFSTPKAPVPPPPPPVRIDTAQVIITEFFADPSPEVGLPLVEFIEIFNPGLDTVDLQGWSINDPQTRGIMRKHLLAPNQYLILSPTADTAIIKGFGKTLGISPWPSLKNSSDEIILKSFKNRTVDSLNYSDTWYKDSKKMAGGWSLEKIDLTNPLCSGFYNWEASLDSAGGTPGRRNSLNKSNHFSEKLKIDSLKIISENILDVYFNQIPDTSYLKAGNFSIKNRAEKAISIHINPSRKELRISFKEKFKEGEKYILSADSLMSCSGNLIRGKDASAEFEIPSIAEIEYPLVINEIFADPSPQIELPEAEFIELYNPSAHTVSLKGLIFGKNLPLKKGEIESDGYLILCAEKDTLNFKQYGKVIGVPLWSSLTNQKDSIQLKNNKGRIIQQVDYSYFWHRDTEKRKGGYSLELINYELQCPDLQKWISSVDSAGGTPGKKNSVHHQKQSLEELKLLEVEVIDSISLIIRFNRDIDSLKASFKENYFVNNGVGMADFASPQAPNFDRVILKFNQALTRGQTYQLTATNISDCWNTIISTNFNYGEFHIAPKIQKNDVLLSEILFNPRIGGVDFIEIYNNATYAIDLRELRLAQISKDSINSIREISKKQLLLASGKYLALTIDPENIKKEYLTEKENSLHKMTSMPVFNDDEGTAVLLSGGKTIDQLSYAEKMHFPLLKNTEGISLERSKLNRPANENGNLRSATMASGGATPGYQNSHYSDEQSIKNDFAILSKTFSPDNDGFEDLLEIKYQASPGEVASISIFNDQGALVKKLVKNYTLNTEGTIIWDGLNDQSQMAPVGIYLLHAEIFNLSGQIKRFRKSFALVSKFK